MKTEKHWEQLGLYPHHGVALPLSALRSEKSCGVGEFYDLLPLIDWCKQIGFDCIQLLPLTDSGSDSSPYNAMSSCALNPMYLSLHALPASPKRASLEEFRPLARLPRTALLEVKQRKMAWLYQYFLHVFPSMQKEADYVGFQETTPWLLSYARFASYKQLYKGISWQDWPEKKRLPPIAEEAIHFHTFLQYLCCSQLREVKKHASSQGIFLKGDLPILLSPDSADVWENSHLFHLDLGAGAPPDYYTPRGQRWGFPLPNWEAMRQTDFSWWKQRLENASQFFHLYRIDHVVGLFRIWAIPKGKSAKEGHFVPKNPHLWKTHGEKLLEMMLEAASLLPIAEDLGTVPKEVPLVLKNLGICGTKVLRWQRDWEGDESYIPYSLYEPFSMTTVSTHDSDTLRGWWKNFPDEAKAFAEFKRWPAAAELSVEQLQEILQDAHRTPSYFHINLLQEYLSLFPELRNENPEEERINIPGQMLATNWTYRFKPSLEEIAQHGPLADVMRSLPGRHF